MPWPIARRIAFRAAQLAVAAAGRLFLFLVLSRQAHAAIATGPLAPPAAGPPSWHTVRAGTDAADCRGAGGVRGGGTPGESRRA